MAKTLLNGVNELLKRANVISGVTGELASLTDASIQNHIDVAVQVLNEFLDEMYEASDQARPNELGEATITLVTSDRDYALAADLVQMRFPLLDETNGREIWEYPGSYEDLVRFQLQPSNWTGLPIYAVIRPTDGELYLDRIPTADENGLIYKYRYDKDQVLSLAADNFPFTDMVFRAMIPGATQLWNREKKRDFDAEIFRMSLGRASRLLTQKQRGTTWLPR